MGTKPLAVDRDPARLARGHGLRELLDMTVVVAQEATQHEFVVAVAQRCIDAQGGLQGRGRQAVGGSAKARRHGWFGQRWRRGAADRVRDGA